jgi:tetratricopeptide (TPR) repeat protein
MDGFVYCINGQVISYQAALKIAASMHTATKDNNISLATNKNSPEYKIYYYRIESWLMDSCEVLQRAIASNDKANDLSFSKNEEALDAYYTGVDFLRKNDHASALPWFKKAVETDSIFVFAWDNLGICYRKTGDLENAEKAYRESLKLDPSGETALQNLPVVYMIQKKDDEAIAAYNNILKHHPKNPEAYYGMGLVYFQNKLDMANALQNMCKAYNIYIEMKSPYRSDAEKVINSIYHEMKKQGKEEEFYRILKENNINAN